MNMLIARAARPDTSSIGALPVALAIDGAIKAFTSIAAAIGLGQGCGQTCITASNDANQVEVLLRQNLAAYLAGQKTQADALAYFDAAWAQLQQVCAGISGDAGAHCVSDRQQGACTWRDASGVCWNWFVGYRDPIVNTPQPAGAVSAGISPNAVFLGLLGLLVVLEVS
jgi:hypothetical protein